MYEDGYINKWEVKYQLDGKDFWNTSNNLSFVVNEIGKYTVKIINGDIPSRKVFEDDDFFVIMDVEPATKGHCLVIPKEHYANLFEIIISFHYWLS